MNGSEALEKIAASKIGVERAPRKRPNDETVGFCCALGSALCYSVSLFSLRALTNYSQVDPDWSIALKELTTVACVLPFILVQCWRGRWKFPGTKAFGTLIAAGISCQVFGARPHMIAYSAIGVALATPLIQAFQLIGTTAIGAVCLKERVSKTGVAAVALLICAVWLLSSSGRGGDGEIAGRSMRLGLGVLCVMCTGLGYSGQLLLMRAVLRPSSESNGSSARRPAPRTPTSLAMTTVTGVGLIVCASSLIAERGVGAFFEPPPACWAFVLTSGFANMLGFGLQIEGLRRLYASKSTLISTAQTLVLAILGVVFFNEPFNASVAAGLILVAIGVALAGLSKRGGSR